MIEPDFHWKNEGEKERREENAVVVTVVCDDGDLADLPRYLSKYDSMRQQELLDLAKRWMGLTSPVGFIGAVSAHLELSPDRKD
jgi:hypothetical protein